METASMPLRSTSSVATVRMRSRLRAASARSTGATSGLAMGSSSDTAPSCRLLDRRLHLADERLGELAEPLARGRVEQGAVEGERRVGHPDRQLLLEHVRLHELEG